MKHPVHPELHFRWARALSLLAVTTVAIGCGDDQGGQTSESEATLTDSGATSTDPSTTTQPSTTSDGTTSTTGGTDTGDTDSGASETGTTTGNTCQANAFTLPGDSFFPEGVAVDAAGRLYVGSLATGEIVTAPEPCGGEPAQTWVAAGGPITGAVGMKVDDARGLLWVCDTDLSFAEPASIDALSLEDGTLVASHPFAGGICNDLILDDAGNIFATNSFTHEVIRVPADAATGGNAAEVWASDPAFVVPEGEFGLNGIAIDDAQYVWVVNFFSGALYRIAIEDDGTAGQIDVVDIEGGPLTTPDGILWYDGGLLVVENFAGQMTRIDVDGGTATRRIVATGLDGPTTVAVTPDGAWLPEGQLGHLLGLDPNPPELPFSVVLVPLAR